jgi:hypothetical protein
MPLLPLFTYAPVLYSQYFVVDFANDREVPFDELPFQREIQPKSCHIHIGCYDLEWQEVVPVGEMSPVSRFLGELPEAYESVPSERQPGKPAWIDGKWLDPFLPWPPEEKWGEEGRTFFPEEVKEMVARIRASLENLPRDDEGNIPVLEPLQQAQARLRAHGKHLFPWTRVKRRSLSISPETLRSLAQFLEGIASQEWGLKRKYVPFGAHFRWF